jgi:hypothetical protein
MGPPQSHARLVAATHCFQNFQNSGKFLLLFLNFCFQILHINNSWSRQIAYRTAWIKPEMRLVGGRLQRHSAPNTIFWGRQPARTPPGVLDPHAFHQGIAQ